MSVTIQCPHCQQQVAVDQALSHQIEEGLRADILKQVELERAEWEKTQKQALWQKAQQFADEKKAKELAELNKQLDETRQQELKLRQERNQLDQEKRNFELEKQRQLDAEREKIRQLVAKELLDNQRLKDAEKDKQIDDMRRQMAEMQLKLNQGSQQLQGEVLELELENELRQVFPTDEIIPVAKGVNGADIIQKVHDHQGRNCGVIVWESKRTKHWTEGWVSKLKEDLMRAKGDLAVLVSLALPEGVKNFGAKDGIYVTTFDCFISLAMVLRRALIEQQVIKNSVVGKNEKMEMVYNYFLSREFQQRVATIAEAFTNMKRDIDEERKTMARLWAKREKEVERVIINTASMHGELQGLIGNALPEVESLQLDALIIETED